jgi:hypothetical protein
MPPPLARTLAGTALGCTLLAPVPAVARVIEFTCTVTFEDSGNTSLRHIRIDTEARTASDNKMTYTDGNTSPYAGDLEQFVDIGAERISWGNRVKNTGTGAGVFTIDTLTGRYAFTSRFRGLLGQGTCLHGTGVT